MKPSCFPVLLPVLLFLFPGACQAGGRNPAAEGPVKPAEVQVIANVAYYDGPGAHPVRHKLDLYLPRGQKDYPVIFFVHGGAWTHGNKTLFGAYPVLGRFWASHGVGFVAINYRLSPQVKHPEHIKDVARAFAWVHRNIARYGGRSDQIFVSGHSAGGHLSALLATDDTYLKAEGLSLRDIRGAIPWSGVFSIPGDNSFFEPIFGRDPKVCRNASPIAHARPDAPPFLILYADHDLPGCGKNSAEAFCRALKDKKANARSLEIKDRNHITIFFDAAREDDPVAKAVREFIQQQTGPGK